MKGESGFFLAWNEEKGEVRNRKRGKTMKAEGRHAALIGAQVEWEKKNEVSLSVA